MTNANEPRSVALPARIRELGPLSENLWWSWRPQAEDLYRDLDPILFESLEENPVLLLRRVDPERLQQAATDPVYLARYDDVIAQFASLRNSGAAATWVGIHQPAMIERPVAYFSAEFGVHPTLPIYSGGLGVLAGDHTKAASDLGLPLVGISLLYRQGYLRQRLSQDGWQLDVTSPLEPGAEPTTPVLDADGKPLCVEIILDDPTVPVRLQIWCVQVGRVSLFLLDADVEGNPDWTRTVSSRLYGGDQEHRLRQEKILGIGGVRALKAMDINPVYWHGNEGHAGFHLLERVREWVDQGLTFAEATERVNASSVFTSHTPVPAGHDVFPPHLMDRYFSYFWPQLGLDREEFLALGHHDASGDGFNMTALSMRLSGYRNGVSARHGEITRAMWHDLWPDVETPLAPITSITNGVHLPTWISPPLQTLLDRYLPADWRERMQEEEVWHPILEVPDEEFWAVRLQNNRTLLAYLHEYSRRRWASGEIDPKQVVASGPFLQPQPLTVGFARRFATYKRATLLFSDPDRLARILTDPARPVQLIFAGKAHPADDGGKRLIQEIFWRSLDPKFEGRIAFAEDYDMMLASRLYGGVDIWLNNPRAPLEASGTSGMKAAANGALNLSILDGWWIEGFAANHDAGWGIAPSELMESKGDEADADAIFTALERHVIPLFYERDINDLPLRWIHMSKEAIRTLAPLFSSQRMVIEYINRLYVPASEGGARWMAQPVAAGGE
ncbi:MAG: alpha-glucan family phosphorylase [Chloroflexia bacterium]|nr:alpha-glucan family phosphorylase [Chloroflexia bacterium]